ncbi:GNAT family N-acetyltransferase [Priestia flexa]|nr:GNAT family N-acetyltransferase [Priestia flexa]
MIRLLTKNDARQYVKLRLESLLESPAAFLKTYDEEASTPQLEEEMGEKLVKEHFYTFGSFRGEQLIGMITLQAEQPLKIRHKGNLLAMYVAKDARGKGVAKELVQVVLDKAKQLGLEQLQLTGVSTNKEAIALYDSFGFVTYAVERNALKYKGQYWDEEHMALSLR